ncbi:MAG: biotin--[acetyl-CoA-carboxylase] ligase [Acidimicrobiales bacterium]
MAGDRARSRLAGTRFADIRWVSETGSTNADLMALAGDGAAEGIVLVADHQTAGRGRLGRQWVAPPGSGLLVSVLLRPPAAVAAVMTMAASTALAEAIDDVAGVPARLKWPNDLVWPGDGSAPDRKLAGVLAEADWPARANIAAGWQEPPPTKRVVVVVGAGVNVSWPSEPSGGELADTATSLGALAGREIDREDLLGAYLAALEPAYAELIGTLDVAAFVGRWRDRSATIGRRVRIDVGAEVLEGMAVDVTGDGRLVVENDDGDRRVLAVGDVEHLRPRA